MFLNSTEFKKIKNYIIVTGLFFSVFLLSGATEESDTSIVENPSSGILNTRKKNKHGEPLILTTAEKVWINKNPIIKVVGLPGEAPIQFYNNVDNKFSGISADYLRIIEAKTGLKFDIIRKDNWEEAFELVKKNQVDILNGVTPTPERFKFMDFSDPYLEVTPVIIVRKSFNKNDISLEEFNGKKVAVVKYSAVGEFVQYNYPYIRAVSVPNAYAGLTLISTGGANAFVINMLQASYYIETEGIINLRVAGKTDYINRVTFGVRKDCNLLVSILNKTLASISEEEAKQVISRWTSFGSDVQNIYSKEFWLILLVVGGGFFLIFVFVMLWNLSLKKQVVYRTKELVKELSVRQKAEHELKEYRNHLEEIVKRRTASLKDANDKLLTEVNERKRIQAALSDAKEVAESANKAKSLFLANMSHEIRTPMNVILGFAELLCRDTKTSNEQKKNLEIIERSGRHLLKLIDQILEVSKIEAGKLTLNEETFNIKDLLADIKLMFEAKLEEKKLDFKVLADSGIPAFLEGDSGKIRQVLVNLLGNAIKFTEAGFISLKIILLEDNGKYVLLKIEVEDSGYGINNREINTLFTPFGQTESGVKNGKGTGLGLAISQRYINLMDSEIKVSSTEGKGSKFNFKLKLKKASSKEVNSSKDITDLKKAYRLKDEYFNRFKILICEDEKENCVLLENLLTQVGFQIEIAQNGEEGLNMLGTFNPDLVLMDLRMPVMNGYEALKRIRESKENKSLPVFAVTANVFNEDRDKAYDVGFNEFLGKPIDTTKLLNLLKKYLKLDYLYSDREPEKDIEKSHKGKIDIPKDIIDSITKAIEEADYDKLLSELSKVEKINKDIADRLKILAENFEYDKIMDSISSKI